MKRRNNQVPVHHLEKAQNQNDFLDDDTKTCWDSIPINQFKNDSNDAVLVGVFDLKSARLLRWLLFFFVT